MTFFRTYGELVLFFAMILGTAFGMGCCVADDMWRDKQPVCQTEDSCEVDYRDGGWHIEEVTP